MKTAESLIKVLSPGYNAMTMQEAYQQGEQKLVQKGIQQAHLDAWYLLEYVTKVSRTMYYAMPGRQLSKEQEKQYLHAIHQRGLHIPLQHLTGAQEFMGLEFQVNEHVLIPRQDTETVVEEAIHIICRCAEDLQAGQKGMCYKVLDMCTGSGCILLSILYHCRCDTAHEEKNKMSVEGIGTDISREALNVARDNALSLRIDARFLESDLFERIHGTYHMIVSNPPYIRSEVIGTLQDEVKLHDPRIALDGNADGLYFYRKIIESAGMYLEKGGVLIFEIGFDQGDAVTALMQKAGFQNIEVKKDLAGLDRVVLGVR